MSEPNKYAQKAVLALMLQKIVTAYEDTKCLVPECFEDEKDGEFVNFPMRSTEFKKLAPELWEVI